MATAHLRVYDHEGSVVATIGELTDNPSTSITNCAEKTVCDLLQTRYGPNVDRDRVLPRQRQGRLVQRSSHLMAPSRYGARSPRTKPRCSPESH